jgi:hypothetical protein
LALSSTRLWKIYKSTSPKVPSLWQKTNMNSLPGSSPKTLPLGALLLTWMTPLYREVRPNPSLVENNVITFPPGATSKHPPFFILDNNSISMGPTDEIHDGDLFLRYKIYHASAAVRKPFLLPHPRNRGDQWWEEAKMAILDDRENFRDIVGWEKYWKAFSWNGLEADERIRAKQLVEDTVVHQSLLTYSAV